jgi:uncharacterized protein YndB with AHSA1/START domain
MNKTKSEPLVIERTYSAPVEVVWKAITNPDDMKRWYFALVNFKPEVGCEFSFVVAHEGVTYDHRCKVTEVIPLRKIAYTWRYEGQPGDSLVTWELFPEGGGTRLRLTHEGLETFPALPAYARKNFEEGWTDFLGRMLPDFLAGKNPRADEQA